jgi:hypothetical protein
MRWNLPVSALSIYSEQYYRVSHKLSTDCSKWGNSCTLNAEVREWVLRGVGIGGYMLDKRKGK